MYKSQLKDMLNNIVGTRLIRIGRAFEMLMFDFGNYALHTQCLTRIIKNNDILVTTLDYLSWDHEHDENNDEWYNLHRFKSVIENSNVVSVELNIFRDLTIVLDNDVTIQVLIQNSYAHYDEEHEQYRFFESLDDDHTEEEYEKHRHYVVYSKHVDLE